MSTIKEIPKIELTAFDLLTRRGRKLRIDFFQEQQDKLGNIFRLDILNRKLIICAEPDGVRHVLLDNNKNYTKSFAYDIIKLFLGNGLLTSEGEFWKRQRRLAQPAFHKQKLELMFNTMVEQTNTAIGQIDRYADSNRKINLSKTLYELTLNIVNKTLFFNEVDSTTDKVYKLVSKGSAYISDRIDNPLRLPLWIPTPKNLMEKAVLASMDKVFYDIIKRRRKQKTTHEDLLSMFMDAVDEETGESMSDKQLRDEILTIFVAGHETTQIALAWTFYLLAINPDKLKILQDEIDDHITDPEMLDMQTLRKMTYLKLVIDESMRIYPPAWVVGRRAIGSDNIMGAEIEPGLNIIMPIYLIHHDKTIWENPEEFIPERFLPENLKDKHKFAYFPFGGGPRLCIGNNFAIQEMQVVLALFLKKYHIEVDKFFIPEMEPLITLRQKNTLRMKLYKR
jgi:cytochrome P450